MSALDTFLDNATAEDALRRETGRHWRCVIEYTDGDDEIRELAVCDWDRIDQAAVVALADVPRDEVGRHNAAVMAAVATVIEAQLPMLLRGVAHWQARGGAAE